MYIYNKIKEDICWVVCIYFTVILLTSLIFNGFAIGFDETDDKLNKTRSGMELRIDHGTGCHYLESSKGMLTPRLQVDGTQICK